MFVNPIVNEKYTWLGAYSQQNASDSFVPNESVIVLPI